MICFYSYCIISKLACIAACKSWSSPQFETFEIIDASGKNGLFLSGFGVYVKNGQKLNQFVYDKLTISIILKEETDFIEP